MTTIEHKSSFRRLAELTDKEIRRQFEDEKVYYINESRLNNMLWCLEQGAKNIKDLEEQVKNLKLKLKATEDILEDYQLQEQ